VFLASVIGNRALWFLVEGFEDEAVRLTNDVLSMVLLNGDK